MHQLERKIHVNSMFDTWWWRASTLPTAATKVVLKLVVTSSYTFQFILHRSNRGLWHIPGLFWYIKYRFLDQMSFEVMHDTLAMSCVTHLLRTAHEICRYLKGWKSLTIKSQKCCICDFYIPGKFVCICIQYLQVP